MKTKFKTSTKSQKQSILENSNLLNSQNYILGFKEKNWILEKIVMYNWKTFIPYFLESIFTIIGIYIYYIHWNTIYEYILNLINNNIEWNLKIFLLLFIPGIILIILFIILSIFTFLNKISQTNYYIRKRKVLIYKKTIKKPIFKENIKVRENQVFWNNLESINNSYYIKTDIAKFQTWKDMFIKSYK